MDNSQSDITEVDDKKDKDSLKCILNPDGVTVTILIPNPKDVDKPIQVTTKLLNQSKEQDNISMNNSLQNISFVSKGAPDRLQPIRKPRSLRPGSMGEDIFNKRLTV